MTTTDVELWRDMRRMLRAFEVSEEDQQRRRAIRRMVVQIEQYLDEPKYRAVRDDEGPRTLDSRVR